MSKPRNSMSHLLTGLALITVLGSCPVARDRGLKRYDLFTVPLGTLPDELDWFYQGGAAGIGDIQTRDGLIYISNSRRGKVMVFNSYGDLLTIVYDPSRNPIPSKGRGSEFNSSISSWPFRSPQIITAFNGGFLVGDRLEDEPREKYKEGSTVFNWVVLRFDREGNYLGHLGREGFGGSPFPDIFAIDVRHDGSIVVICHPFDSGTWFSYWYTKDGLPITTIQIGEDRLPDIGNDKDVKVQAVRSNPRDWLLHLKVDIHGKVEPGGDLEARLYTLNLSTLEYDESIYLPYSEGHMGYPPGPPEYLGTTLDGSHAMLYQEGPDTYRIFMLDAQDNTAYSRRLKVDSDASIYRLFKIQNDGLLVGMFFGNSGAAVSWWRLDEILKE